MTALPLKNNLPQPENNLPLIWQEDPGQVCSYHTCSAGHKWPIQLATTHCKGCNHPLIAMRMTNCPVCNEPAQATSLRIDYIAQSHPITKVCLNEHHTGPEYITTLISHRHNSRLIAGLPVDAPQLTTSESLTHIQNA